MTIDLEKLVTEVNLLCQEVGQFIGAECRSFDRGRIESKTGFNNLVSYVDKQAERALVDRLQTLFPGAGVIAEEGTGARAAEFNWIIDPLDGTTNFMHGMPVFAISVALARKEEVLLGVVHEVNRSETFHTIKGGPAYCNGQPVRVSSVRRLDESLLATGFPYYHSDKQDAYLEIIKEFLLKTHGIRRLGSAATDLAYVAAGRFEGFFEYNLNPWDVAAGAFLVQQAGGLVTDFSGGKNYLHGGQIIAGNSVHAEMLEVIRLRWKP
jgi:myo-inositol-1(or 4)-monophosphatase